MNAKKTLKWTAVALGGTIAAATVYFVRNTYDGEMPDITEFENAVEVPSATDNVFCGLVAATNATSKKTGEPVMVVLSQGKAWSVLRMTWAQFPSEDIDELLSDASEAISLFRNAARRKTWYAIDLSTGERATFPPISAMSTLCRLTRLHALQKLYHGEIGEATDCVRDLVTFARKVENDAECSLGWIAADGFALHHALSVAKTIATSGKATDEELHRLLDAMREFDLDSRPEKVQRMLNNDYTMYFKSFADIKELRKLSDSNMGGLSDSEMEDCARALRHPLLLAYAYHRNTTWTIYAELLRKVKFLYRNGYDAKDWKNLNEEVLEAVEGGWRFGPNFGGRAVLKATVPAWHSVACQIANSEFKFSGVEVIIAAELFRRKTGAYPKSLEALVPEFLPAVPRDPFTRGEAIKYDAERGVVWTVGKDGTFNGQPDLKPTNPRSWNLYEVAHRACILNIDGTPLPLSERELKEREKESGNGNQSEK